MAKRLEVQGGRGGRRWDDGSEYEGVTKILITVGGNGIQNVKFVYVKNGKTEESPLHGVIPRRDEGAIPFVINHPEEYLISVEGWYSSGEEIIHGIKFKTNKKDCDYVGVPVDEDDTPIKLEVPGKKIIGFHGYSGNYLKSIGAYFVPVPLKLQETKWDDGSHKKVKKVQLTYNDDIIHSIQVTYDGTDFQFPLRGTVGPKSDEFTLDSEEYITAVFGYHEERETEDDKTKTEKVITALTFTTNKMCYGQYGNKSKSSVPFSAPEVPGKQIAGFHGSSSDVLHSIDFHYAPVPAKKSDVRGGTRETAWDHGSDRDGVTNIVGISDEKGVQWLSFDYVKGGILETQERSHDNNRRVKTIPFTINHPDEYLVLVKGWCDSSNVIKGIQFTNNLGKTYNTIGFDKHVGDTDFALHDQDKKIVGFHGFANHRLTSIGAYFGPSAVTPSTPILKKFRGFGGDGGTSWDDGAFDGVRKVFVGQTPLGIGMVEFVYSKDDAEIVGAEHGTLTDMGGDTFELDYPEEYIIEVKGTYDKIIGSTTEVMPMLEFITNKKTFGPFGPKAGEPFTLNLEGHKIVGFHGSSTNLLHKIGVYVIPITN